MNRIQEGLSAEVDLGAIATGWIIIILAMFIAPGCAKNWNRAEAPIRKRSITPFVFNDHGKVYIETIDVPSLGGILVSAELKRKSLLPSFNNTTRGFAAFVQVGNGKTLLTKANQGNLDTLDWRVIALVPFDPTLVEDNQKPDSDSDVMAYNRMWRAAPNSLILWRSLLDVKENRLKLDIRGLLRKNDMRVLHSASDSIGSLDSNLFSASVAIDLNELIWGSRFDSIEEGKYFPWDRGLFVSMNTLTLANRFDEAVYISLLESSGDEALNPVPYHIIKLRSHIDKSLVMSSLSWDGQFALFHDWGVMGKTYFLYDVNGESFRRIGRTSKAVDFVYYSDRDREEAIMLAIDAIEDLLRSEQEGDVATNLPSKFDAMCRLIDHRWE